MAATASPAASLLSPFLGAFPAVLEHVPIMTWLTDVHGHCTFTNRAWRAFTGATTGEDLGFGWTDRLHPDDRERCVSEYTRAHAARMAFRAECRWKRHDGAYCVLETSGVPLCDPGGQFQGYVGLCVDVTDQRGTARALAALISNMNDAVLVESDEGAVVLANAAFCRLFGLAGPPQSLVGMPAASVAGPLQRWQRRFTRLKQRGRRLVGEEIHLADDRVLELQYARIEQGGAAPVHLWQYRDISARKRFETELHASRQRLRELGARAEAVREEERRSAARMLHDELGQLLTAAKLELAAATGVFRAQPDERALAVVDRLQSAVGLLDVCITTVQRVSAKLRPTPIPEMRISDALVCESLLFEERTRIRCRAVISPPKLEVDPDRSAALYRILMEALTNVVRHAEAGAVQIALKKTAGVVFLSIRDNGKGIAQEDIDNPATMGLLGMRERALALGGDVRITRGIRGGTTVMAILPLPVEPPAARGSGGGSVRA